MPQDLFNTQELSPHIEEELPLKEQLLPLRDKDLPPIIREVVSNAPANRKLPSFVACLAPLCALATRIRLHYYYDGQRTSALLLQVVIEGPQSIGKQFAADIEHLLTDNTLKAHDEKQRRLEQDYREKKNARAQNEKIGELPKTTIRVIPATISKTVLVRRADYYERNLGDVLTFWMFAEELAQVTDAGKQGYSNLRTIMRTAYDFGSTFGMDFASDNSYSAIVDINICSMFCATPSALDDYMDKKAVEGGNITRTVLCQLEDQIGSDGAIFKPYTPEQLATINATLERMMADVYTPEGALREEMYLDTSWIERDVRKWCQAKGREALQSGSAAIDVFRKRASVSAFRIMALCYYLYQLDPNLEPGTLKAASKREESEARFDSSEREQARPEVNLNLVQRKCRKIYLFCADYIFQMLLKRWGRTFEDLQARRNDQIVDTGRPKLIDRLPHQFTRDQLRALIQEQQVATPDRILVSQWKSNKWIEEKEKFVYLKLI